MSDKSYFAPSRITPYNDFSLMLGIIPTLIIPANINRAGFILQNLSDTNDVWWGHDSNVGPNILGCFRLQGGYPVPWKTDNDGVWSGPVWAISDGGSRLTVKEFIQN